MSTKNPQGFNPDVVKRRLFWTWLQTVLGVGFIGALTVGALVWLGFNWSVGLVVLLVWSLLPLLSWYHSGTLVLKLMRCQAPNPKNANHMRLVRIVDKLYPKTGLEWKPPVYISPIPMPNAFATGRNPKHSFIAATEGLLHCGLNDEELEAVLAHELAHVKTRDVAIGSFTAVMGSLFAILLAGGLPRLFHAAFSSNGAPLLDRLSQKVKHEKKRFFLPDGGLVGFVFMLVIFYFVSVFTKLVTMFVGRSRESAADVLAAQWTGNPCALSMALQKIRHFLDNHRPDIRLIVITRGLTPILLVNALDDEDEDAEGGSLMTRLRRWWRRLGENHPPVSHRMAALDEMAGGSCPRLEK